MRRGAWGPLALALALVAGACGNADGGDTADKSTDTTADTTADTGTGEKVTVDAPGVSDTEIRVGGVASVTNPLGGKYGDSFDGVEGVLRDGERARAASTAASSCSPRSSDDKLANNKAEVDALIGGDVFAILPIATLLFSGADSAVAAEHPDLRLDHQPGVGGHRRRTHAPTCSARPARTSASTDPSPSLPWLAKELGAKKIGVLAYNVDAVRVVRRRREEQLRQVRRGRRRRDRRTSTRHSRTATRT